MSTRAATTTPRRARTRTIASATRATVVSGSGRPVDSAEVWKTRPMRSGATEPSSRTRVYHTSWTAQTPPTQSTGILVHASRTRRYE